MQIDWVTVGAQIINFLVLVYLLKRFLYAPIVNAMDKRQQGIAAALAEAQQKVAAAEGEAQHYRQLSAEFEQQKATLLSAAKAEVEVQRQQLVQALRNEVAAQRDQWLAEIERDKQHYSQRLRQALAQQACDISRRLLRDLADAGLEAQMIQSFVRRLETLDETEQEQLRQSAARGLQIESAFVIDAAQQVQLRRALERLLGVDTAITFVVNGAALCGLVLRSEGHKITWNMASYLDGIEAALPGAMIDVR